jgi:hypothetical protein
MTRLYDIRFDYKFDNPFPNDSNRALLKIFRQTIAKNNKTYCEINYLEDSFYTTITGSKVLFNKVVVDNKITNNPLINTIKDFIRNVRGTSQNMQKWCGDRVLQPIEQSNVSDDNEDNNDEDKPSFNTDYGFIGTGFISSTMNTLYNYDISGDICINYDDLKALCLNIARYKLAPDNKKDEMVKSLENEKRRKLIVEIDRFRKIKEIAVENDFDIVEFNNEQLEYCLEKCKADFERYKLQDISFKGCKIGEALYDKIFPDGIPISKTKKLRFGGVGKEIIKQMFDTRTPAGVSWTNILKSKNIHISDGMLVVATLAQTLITKIEIYEEKPTENEEKPTENEPVKSLYAETESESDSDSSD